MNTHPHYLYSDIVNSIKDTKANIIAMTGLLDGSLAYATDTDELGTYNADTNVWTWLGAGGGGSSFDNFWNSGSAGAFSIRAKNNTTINAVSDYAMAIGGNTYASGSYSRAEGFGSVTAADQAHAEGSATEARGPQSHTEGLLTVAYGTASHAEGLSTRAFGQSSHAEGNTTTASGTNSLAAGQQNAAIGVNSAAIGGRNNRVLGDGSVLLGGSGTNGVFNDTVFVPNLNVRFVQSGTPITNIGIDSNGNVVSGTVVGSAINQINEEGISLGGSPTILNFVGGGIFASISGTIVEVFVTGSVSDAKFVTTAEHAGLSDEVIIPGLAGSPDIKGVNGAGSSREFDDTTAIYSWTGTFHVNIDYNTTIKSHVYLRATGTAATEAVGTEPWLPVGAFDLRAGAVQLTVEAITNAANQFGLVVLSQDMSAGGLVHVLYNPSGAGSTLIQAYSKTGGTFTQRGASWTVPPTVPVWLRITRDNSNNLSFWFSYSGKDGMYQLIATQALTFTAARRGFRLVNSILNSNYACDWVRTNV